MGSSDCNSNLSGGFKYVQDLYPESDAFCVDKLTPAHFRYLLSHLNIAAAQDMDLEKLKEVLSFSSIYMELFKSYKLSDVIVLFSDSQVVNIVSIDKKVALYQLDCEYPCVACHFNVDDEGIKGQGLECSLCESWFHNNCTDSPLSDDLYNSLTESPNFIKIFCPPCLNNNQVKKLHEKINTMQCDFKGELAAVKQALSDLNDDVSPIKSLKHEIGLVNCKIDVLKESFHNGLDTVINKIQTHELSISSIKAEVCSDLNVEFADVKSVMNTHIDKYKIDFDKMTKELQSCSKHQASKSDITGLQDFISEVKELICGLDERMVPGSIDETTVPELKESIDGAVQTMVTLEKSLDTMTGSYEAALDSVVTQANRLNSIDIPALTSNLSASAEDISNRINQQFLQPTTVDKIAEKVAKLVPTKSNSCSGNCITKIEGKLYEVVESIFSENFSAPSTLSAASTSSIASSSSVSESPSAPWTTAVSRKTSALKNGSITKSARGKALPVSNSLTASHPIISNEMDMKKTITIGNVTDASVSNSAIIKSVFNKCFPRMEIVHCKRTINGFILVEVDTPENAKKVVALWDGSKFFKSREGGNTFAHVLEDARAKAIIEDVDKELNDEFLTQEIQKTFPNALATRLKNRHGTTHVVLLNFASNSDLEQANKEKILIGNTIYRTKPYQVRKRLTQCYQCFSFNHIARNCTKVRVCPYCCGNHEERECEIKRKHETDNYVCVNCRGNHSALSKECEVYKKLDQKRNTYND